MVAGKEDILTEDNKWGKVGLKVTQGVKGHLKSNGRCSNHCVSLLLCFAQLDNRLMQAERCCRNQAGMILFYCTGQGFRPRQKFPEGTVEMKA